MHQLSLKNAFRARLPSKLHLQLIHQHHLQSHLHCGNDPTVANHNGIPSATHPPSTTCNPICIAGTILQLQITMEFCRPHMHEKHLKPHLQCGTDPTMIREYPRMTRPHTRPSRTRRTAKVDHRRSGTDFVWKKHRVSCICYLSKTHFVRDFLQNSIGNSSTSTTCNPIFTVREQFLC